MEPRGPPPGPGRGGQPGEAHWPLNASGRGQSQGNRDGGPHEEVPGPKLPDPGKEEGVGTPTHVETPAEGPGESEPRNCNRGPTLRDEGPLCPTHVSHPPSATTAESRTQTEPEPSLDLGEETLGQRSRGRAARRRDKWRGAETSDEALSEWSERKVREVSRRVLSVLRQALGADTLEPDKETPGNPAARRRRTSGEGSGGNTPQGGPYPLRGWS